MYLENISTFYMKLARQVSKSNYPIDFFPMHVKMPKFEGKSEFM